MGRFLAPDVMVPGAGRPPALNRYTYVLNNPVRYTDPTGHAYEQGHGGGIGRYNSIASAWQLAGLMVFQWFMEFGPETVELGIDRSSTQDVRAEPQITEFYQAWAQSGYRIPFEWEPPTIDRRSGTFDPGLFGEGMATLLKENLINMPYALIGLGSPTPEGKRDALGGTLGSFDKITIHREAHVQGALKVSVENKTGWNSFTRPPSQKQGILTDKDRGSIWWAPIENAPLAILNPFGGTCKQVFSWRIAYWPGGAPYGR